MTANIKLVVPNVAREGISKEESAEGYKQWASTYEKDMSSARFAGPAITARYLSDSIPKEARATARVMDVGAGTGFVAKELKEFGFQHIDGLDSSAAMLEEAKKRNYYENYIVNYISKDPLNIPADTYDGLTGSGCYGEGGHFPADALYEMIRLVKPGGYIVLTTRSHLVDPASAIAANKDLEPLMNKLEAAGKWRKVCRDVGKEKFYADYDAIVWKYQVL